MANKRQPVPGVTDTVITFSPTVLSEVPEGDSRAFGNEDAATRPVVLGDLFDDDHRPIRADVMNSADCMATNVTAEVNQ